MQKRYLHIFRFNFWTYCDLWNYYISVIGKSFECRIVIIHVFDQDSYLNSIGWHLYRAYRAKNDCFCFGNRLCDCILLLVYLNIWGEIFFELFNVIILWQLLPIKLSIKISQLPSSNNFATKPQRTSQQITATINICLHWYFDYMQVVSKIKGGKYPRAQTNIILLLEMFRCLLRKPGKLFVYNWNWIKRDGEFNASLKPYIRCRQKSIFYPEMLSHIIVAVDVQGVSF